MLLNATHELTNCGLPEHIQERYVRYKQGNRAIVAWMTKYGPEEFKGRKTLPIKQLIALGKILCNKIEDIGILPSDVDYYFKEVIRERAYLSQHFRHFRDRCEEDEIDTINHEHFTSSLKQIHQILLTAGKPSTKTRVLVSKTAKHSRSSTSSSHEIKNTFARLLSSVHDQNDSEESDDDAVSDTDTNITSDCSHSSTGNHACPCEDDEDDADFLDLEGSVGVAVETTMFLKALAQISDAIKVCWMKAGHEKTPVAATAAYNNVLLVRAVGCTREFCQVDVETTGLPNLRSRLESFTCDGNPELGSTEHEVADMAKALCLVYDEIVLQSTKAVAKANWGAPSSVEHTANPESLVNILVSSLQHAYECRTNSSLTFDGIPCVAELFSNDGYDGDDSTTLISSVIIYMMSVSHCAYSSTLSQASHIAVPRIKALKFANEAVGVIKSFIDDKSIFPCQCVNTLAYRVTQMGRDLEAFAKYKCWNVVSQSPLVAGNHVLEIHDLCSYYGMHLFHYRQYVAAVLHPYQALVKLNALEKNHTLEAVCDLFTPVLYTTGTRPECGFMASWLRYIGARLKFKSGKKHQNHKDTWCMSVPAHAAARSAGLNISQRNGDINIQPKFDYGTVDSIIKLKRGGWILHGNAAQLLDEELHTGPLNDFEHSPSSQSEQTITTSQKTKRTKHARTKSCCVSKTMTAAENGCSRLTHTFADSFTVDSLQGRVLPPSRFNLLSFFHSMTKVVSGISDFTHAEDEKSGGPRNNGQGQMCLCFVQVILRGADRILDVRKRAGIDAKGAVWTKNEKECIECYKDFLRKMLIEAKVLDGDGGVWLWGNV